ncbi:MAG: hypothetical protein CW716_02665 [Candidatus Bathyarchaeum sp.]|nr:MAG: hypothetical protein CW716_02665 [Candidatus Bathyarchaeum sp.]
MDAMAYLREEKETVEADYPVDQVWAAAHKALKALKWTIEENNAQTYSLKVKTKKSFLSYSSIMQINAKQVSKKTTQITVAAETPVTTITAIADFGKTHERIDLFLAALMSQLTSKTDSSK